MIKTPRCPECDSLPDLILADGHQCFCPNDDCQIMIWDSHQTAEEIAASFKQVIDLDEKP
jgi:hypothetical protein